MSNRYRSISVIFLGAVLIGLVSAPASASTTTICVNIKASPVSVTQGYSLRLGADWCSNQGPAVMTIDLSKKETPSITQDHRFRVKLPKGGLSAGSRLTKVVLNTGSVMGSYGSVSLVMTHAPVMPRTVSCGSATTTITRAKGTLSGSFSFVADSGFFNTITESAFSARVVRTTSPTAGCGGGTGKLVCPAAGSFLVADESSSTQGTETFARDMSAGSGFFIFARSDLLTNHVAVTRAIAVRASGFLTLSIDAASSSAAFDLSSGNPYISGTISANGGAGQKSRQRCGGSTYITWSWPQPFTASGTITANFDSVGPISWDSSGATNLFAAVTTVK